MDQHTTILLRTDEELALSSQSQSSQVKESSSKRKSSQPSQSSGQPIQKRTKTNQNQPNVVDLALDQNQWRVENIICPEDCSLYNTVKVQWRITTESQFPIYSSNLIQSHHEQPLPNKNGLWFQIHSHSSSLVFKQEFSILLQLFEIDETNAVRPVAFCSKCAKKKSQIIELTDSKVTSEGNGVFSASITINEQCAHRAQNQYGTPKTKFFFGVQLWGCDKGSDRKMLVQSNSNYIKVVAPGKCQITTKKSKSSPSKHINEIVQQQQSTINNLQSQVGSLQLLYSTLAGELSQIKSQLFDKIPSVPFHKLLLKGECSGGDKYNGDLINQINDFILQQHPQLKDERPVSCADSIAQYNEPIVESFDPTTPSSVTLEADSNINEDLIESLSQELLHDDQEALTLLTNMS